MKVLNIHQRTITQPKEKIIELFETLATPEDQIWPFERWPKMKFKDGLKIGSKGGHGPIRYTVEQLEKDNVFEFRFTKPNGFNGIHRLEINELEKDKTEVRHVIDIETSVQGTIIWNIGVRWLHDALIEDALDKIENQFLLQKKKTNWNFWVRFLRKLLK